MDLSLPLEIDIKKPFMHLLAWSVVLTRSESSSSEDSSEEDDSSDEDMDVDETL